MSISSTCTASAISNACVASIISKIRESGFISMRSFFILSICLVPSARYICLAANSIYFRFAQTRYDINPRSRSEHIEHLLSKCHIERLRSKHYIENPRERIYIDAQHICILAHFALVKVNHRGDEERQRYCKCKNHRQNGNAVCVDCQITRGH